MNTHRQEPPKTVEIYRAWVVDHYNGTLVQVPGGPWIGRAYAEDALEKYFKKHPAKSVTDYDIGGYVEEVKLDLALNPKA